MGTYEDTALIPTPLVLLGQGVYSRSITLDPNPLTAEQIGAASELHDSHRAGFNADRLRRIEQWLNGEHA